MAAGAEAVDLGRESLPVRGLALLGGGLLDGLELVAAGQVGLVLFDGFRQLIAFPALFGGVPGGVQIGLDDVFHAVGAAGDLTGLGVKDDLVSVPAHRVLRVFVLLGCAPLLFTCLLYDNIIMLSIVK